MPTDEVTLILNAIDSVRADIKDSEKRLTDRVRDVAIVVDEHSERLVGLETRVKLSDAGRITQPKGVNFKRVAVVSGAGGFLTFLPNLIHSAAEFVKALPQK